MPQQMSGEGCNGVIALAFHHARSGQLTPVVQAMSGT